MDAVSGLSKGGPAVIQEVYYLVADCFSDAFDLPIQKRSITCFTTRGKAEKRIEPLREKILAGGVFDRVEIHIKKLEVVE